MSNHSRRALKRTAGAAIAALAGASSIALVPGSAGALPGFEFERIDGLDRYATAADIALEAFPGGTDNVLLATGENFPDALAGNYLAGALNAPILLAHHDDVPQATVDALAALDPDTVTLLGGTTALEAGVAAELSGLGYSVDRISGADRFDTARLIAVQGSASGIGLIDGAETAIVATGGNFPDALAIGPLAYDAGFPILLTPSNSLAPAVSAAIDELNIEHVVVLGGDGAVSGAVQSAIGGLGVTTERISGDTRFSTATAIAERAIEDFGFSTTHVDLASGRNFPDALAGGALGGVEGATLVLSEPNEAASETCEFLQGHADTLETGHALGGTQALSNASLQELRQCAGGEAPNEEPRANQDFNVTPSTAVLGELGTDGIARETYVFSDILPGTEVDITFVPCFTVTRDDAARNVAIADDPTPQDFLFNIDAGENDNRVEPGGLLFDYLGMGHSTYFGFGFATAIFAVNGEIQPGGFTYVDDFNVPASGQLSIEFLSTQEDCVVPLVFDDTASGDDRLDLAPDSNFPTDPFAVGGALIATNGEAGDGEEIDGQIMYIDKEENWYASDDSDTPILDGNIYFYEDTDEFWYDADGYQFINGPFTLSAERWETYASPLDEIDNDGAGPADADYSRSAGNDFQIDNDWAGTVTGVTVVMGDFDDDPTDSNLNDAKVTWNTPDPANGFIVDYIIDQYQVGAPVVLTAGRDSDDDPVPATPPEPNQDVDNDNIDDDVDNEAIIENLSVGNWQFVVWAVTATKNPGLGNPGESLFGSEPSAAVQGFSPGAPGAPLSVVSSFTEPLPLATGQLSTGDILLVEFNENIFITGTTTDVITLTDADGTVGRVINTLGSNWATGANFLLVQLTTGPFIDVPGGDGVLSFPVTVTDSDGITDVGGVEWNITDSPDKSF